MNQVQLIGRITKDLELRNSSAGKSFVAFTLAVSSYSSGKEFTNFIPCFAWERSAENMAKYLSKGSLIAVEGSISARSENKDGVYQNIVTVTAQRVEFLESRNSNQSRDFEPVQDFNPQPNSNFDLDVVNNFSANENKETPVKQSFSNDDDDSILWD
ncbi:single-strand DNA-binding protein [Spiroplasma sabaudiense Ar-1343]|uniref:Single-stranded DNA-binding protein n=1 Tax=Spiroplasma sabaudiense Ar-1343 TaxID=1276257 RepID=W6AI99_9MOLU|nr:single-stranded DNA-binding protein [Spiroplasma sabaudiense]AHI53434.1 single-strand DNA-binding protein [Spiroplasma sabaudiense Ar-1343]